MPYLVILLLLAVALVIFLHNDHDRSYDKKKSQVSLPPEQPTVRPKVEPKPEPRPEPKKAPKVEPEPRPKPEPKVEPRRTLTWTYLAAVEYDEDLPEMTMETEVTGMRYYCSLADVGPVNGIVRPEPDNPHDARAQVVIRADGKKLGYIPRYALDEYENFNEYGHVCPFAGTVTVDNNGYMLAFILVALPVSPTFVKEELTGYVGAQ